MINRTETSIETINHTGIKYKSYLNICLCKVCEECSSESTARSKWEKQKYSWNYFNRTPECFVSSETRLSSFLMHKYTDNTLNNNKRKLSSIYHCGWDARNGTACLKYEYIFAVCRLQLQLLEMKRTQSIYHTLSCVRLLLSEWTAAMQSD